MQPTLKSSLNITFSVQFFCSSKFPFLTLFMVWQEAEEAAILEEERLAAQMEREAMQDGEEDYEDEEEGEEDEEEDDEEDEEERVVVVKNSPSNYSALSYEMFVEQQKAGELDKDDNKELASLAGSFAPSSSNNHSYMSNNQINQQAGGANHHNNQDSHSYNSTQRGEEEERASVRTNSSSLGPRKVGIIWKWHQIGGANSITAVCRLTSSR